ncbi:MAG: helix-turn-helix transcriptional regulator [Chlorobiota bacterium]
MNNTITINLSNEDKDSIIEGVFNRVSELLKKQNPAPPTDLDGEELKTREEVMKFLNISSSTLWHLVKDGKLNQIKYGGRVAFRKKELQRFIEASTVNNVQ